MHHLLAWTADDRQGSRARLPSLCSPPPPISSVLPVTLLSEHPTTCATRLPLPLPSSEPCSRSSTFSPTWGSRRRRIASQSGRPTSPQLRSTATTRRSTRRSDRARVVSCARPRPHPTQSILTLPPGRMKKIKCSQGAFISKSSSNRTNLAWIPQSARGASTAPSERGRRVGRTRPPHASTRMRTPTARKYPASSRTAPPRSASWAAAHRVQLRGTSPTVQASGRLGLDSRRWRAGRSTTWALVSLDLKL